MLVSAFAGNRLSGVPMNDDAQAIFGKIIAKAASDAEFRQRLISDPRAAFSELGIDPPKGMENLTLKVVENTADTVHLVLPASIPQRELDDEVASGLSEIRRPLNFWTHAWLLGSAAVLWSAPRSELLHRALYRASSER